MESRWWWFVVNGGRSCLKGKGRRDERVWKLGGNNFFLDKERKLRWKTLIILWMD